MATSQELPKIDSLSPAEPTEVSPKKNEAGAELLENNNGEINETTTDNSIGLGDIEKKYDLVLGLSENVRRAEEEISKDKKEINSMRESFGLPPAALTTANSKAGDRTRENLEQAVEETENIESKYLSVPEETEAERSKETKEHEIEKRFEEENEKTKKEMEEELEKMKEQFVEEYVNQATQELSKNFQSDFENSENGEKAKDLLVFKIKYVITEGTEDWAKNKDAGPVHFALPVKISFSSFNTEKGKEQYVMAIDVSLNMNSFEAGGNSKEGDELTSEKEKQSLESAEQTGVLEKDEKVASSN